MISFDQDKIQKEIYSGGINKLVLLFGFLLFFMGGWTGGNANIYVLVLIVIPLFFIFMQKMRNVVAWLISLLSVIYAGVLYTLAFPDITGSSFILYGVLLFEFYRYFSVRKLFVKEHKSI